jgi:GTPase SAR1 family protein
VGKTAILTQFAEKNFNQLKVSTTLGVDFNSKTIQVGKNKNAKLQIWDTVILLPLPFLIFFKNLFY